MLFNTFSCCAECEAIPKIKFGKIKYRNDINDILIAGTHATFTCHKSTILTGNVDSYCFSYGQWNRAPPTCEGKYLIMEMQGLV